MLIFGVVFVVFGVLMLLAHRKIKGISENDPSAPKPLKIQAVLSGVLIFFGLVFVLAGSGGEKETEKAAAAVEAVEVVADSRAIALVRATQKSPKARESRTAPLSGGVAVLSDNQAGYWVKGGVVYATNGVAKSWSESVAYAPAEIDQAHIEKAISDHYGER